MRKTKKERLETLLENVIKYVEDNYVEKNDTTITRFQHGMLARLSENGYKFIARDGDTGSVYAYRVLPKREENFWDSPTADMLGLMVFAEDFSFVHWEDEPYAIDELLKCEVEE